jgi:hypothetical protein
MLKAEFLIGEQLENEWSGIYGYKPDDITSQTEMFVTIRVAVAKDEFSLENIAKILLDELQASYYENNKDYDDKVEKLEESIWKMKSKMEYILSREPALSEYGLDIEMAVAIFDEGILYLAVIGESKIFIQRADKFVEISKGLVDASMRGFFKSGSIELKEEDKLCLATSKAATKGSVAIQLALSELDISKLDELKENSGIACLVLGDENLPWATKANEELVMSNDQLVEETVELKNGKLMANEDEPSALSLQPSEGEEKSELQITNDELRMKNEESLDEQANNNLEVKPEEKANVEYGEDVEAMRESENISMKDKAKQMFTSGLAFGKDKFQLGTSKIKALMTRNKGEDDSDIDDEPRFSHIQTAEEGEMEYQNDESRNVKDRVFTTAKTAASKTKGAWNNTVGAHFKNNKKTYATIFQTIIDKIKEISGDIMAVFKREIVGSGDRRDKYLRGKRMRRNRVILVVVIVVLIVVIFIGFRNAEDARKKQEQVDAARAQITAFENKLSTLSPQILQARTEGEQKKTLLLGELQKLTNDINLQKRNGLFVDELDNLAKDVSEKQDDLLLVVPVTDPKILVDIGKNYPDATLSDIVYSNGSIFISDSARGAVYRVASTGLGAQPQVYVTGLVQPYLLVRNVDGNIVFFDNDTTTSIGKFSFNQEQAVTRFPGLPPSSVGKPIEAALYDGNDALYELRQTNKQLFRRNKDGDGYVPGGAAPSTDPETEWRTDPDFGSAVDISVPRNIYILIKNQGLKRYFAGGENDIAYETYTNFMRSDFEAIKQGTALDVADGNIVIGDPVNRRVLLFKYEDGDAAKINFVKQYAYRGTDSTTFSDIDEVVVVQSENTIYVLDGGKVVKLDM